ncbi:MAG: 50S ribosomal protein L7/L12, partial [Anaerolineae bacterium]
MADLEQIVQQISELSLLEASQLVSMLEEELGVSAAAPVAMAAMPGMAAAVEEEEEEKTEFNVVITEVGPKKIQVIKAVRQLTSLGLRE